MTDTLHITFLFALGDRVRWDHDTAHTYLVVWRRWHQGEASTWVEYGLAREEDIHMTWQAYEVDLEPADDER